MTNPFDNEEGEFLVLINDENQHSLWPNGMDIPLGWASAYGPATRKQCVGYVDEHWTDMRPASLITAMKKT
jgi:MbtH protein